VYSTSCGCFRRVQLLMIAIYTYMCISRQRTSLCVSPFNDYNMFITYNTTYNTLQHQGNRTSEAGVRIQFTAFWHRRVEYVTFDMGDLNRWSCRLVGRFRFVRRAHARAHAHARTSFLRRRVFALGSHANPDFSTLTKMHQRFF
jgi:hypothetical protein